MTPPIPWQPFDLRFRQLVDPTIMCLWWLPIDGVHEVFVGRAAYWIRIRIGGRPRRGGCSRSLTTGSGGGRYDKQPHVIIPEIAGTLAASGAGTARVNGNLNQESQLIPEVADCLQERDSKGSEDGTGRGTPLVPTIFQECQTGVREYDDCGTLRANGPGHDPVGSRLRIGMAVRRLTPKECERLMGWPDDHTAGFSDSTRYKMCGNGVVEACSEWIGKRIVKFATP